MHFGFFEFSFLGPCSVSFYHVRYPKGKDMVNILQLRELQGCKGGRMVMANGPIRAKQVSCDWSTRFMRVIFLYRRTETGLLSCDWSTRFMRVIFLYRRTETGLQYNCTAVQLIQA